MSQERIIDRVGVEYVGIADQFFRVSEDVERRGQEIAGRFQTAASGSTAKAAASSALPLQIAAGAAISAGLLAGIPTFGNRLGKELRSIGQKISTGDFREQLASQRNLDSTRGIEKTVKNESNEAEIKRLTERQQELQQRSAEAAAAGHRAIAIWHSIDGLVTQLNMKWRETWRATASVFNLMKWSVLLAPMQAVYSATSSIIPVVSSLGVAAYNAAGGLAGLGHALAYAAPYAPFGAAVLAVKALWSWTRRYRDEVLTAVRDNGLLAGSIRAIRPITAPVAAVGRGVAAVGRTQVAGPMAIGLGVAAVGAVTAGWIGAAKAASDYEEAANKSGEIFRSAESDATKFVDAVAAKYGFAKTETTNTMSAYGQLFESTGKGSKEIEQLSEEFTKLTMDATSFYNVDMETALTKIRSGLAGESEPMRQFGVFLTENAVKMEAYRLGIAKTGAELSESQKIEARLSLIRKGMSNAKGDLDRTADSPANQMRKIQGTIQNMAIEKGKLLQPVLKEGLGAIGDMLGWLQKSFESNKATISEWANWFANGIAQARLVLSQLPIAWEMVQLSVTSRINNIGAYMYYLWDLTTTVAGGIAEDFPGLLKEGFWNVVTIGKNVITNLYNIFTGGWDNILASLRLGFDKLVAYLDSATGGLVSKVMDVKSEDQLASEWGRLKNELNLKDLGEGTDTSRYQQLKDRAGKVQGPQLIDVSESLAKLSDKMVEGIAKAEEEKKKTKDGLAKPDGAAKTPQQKLAEAGAAKQREKIEIRWSNAEEFGRSVQEGLLKTEKSHEKNQEKFQKELLEVQKEQLIIERRKEKRSGATVVAA